MNSPSTILILFLLGALVAIGAGIAINSALLIAAGLVLAVIGAALAWRHRGER
jgi:hypothetical protein